MGSISSDPKLLAISILAVIILASIAILFCFLWIKQIEEFKDLNNEKFSVLNEMAEHVVFSNNVNDPRMSYSPFMREWEQLQRKKKLLEPKKDKDKNTQIISLKSTTLEYLVPKAFRALYILILVLVAIIITINREEICNTTLRLSPQTPSSVTNETKG